MSEPTTESLVERVRLGLFAEDTNPRYPDSALAALTALQSRCEELERDWNRGAELDQARLAQIEELERERDHWKQEASGLASEQAHAERAEATVQRLREAIHNASYALDPNQGEAKDAIRAYQWLRTTFPTDHPNYVDPAALSEEPRTHEDKGFSEEKCLRCGWVMGQPPLNCNNDDTPHRFPSQLALSEEPRT